MKQSSASRGSSLASTVAVESAFIVLVPLVYYKEALMMVSDKCMRPECYKRTLPSGILVFALSALYPSNSQPPVCSFQANLRRAKCQQSIDERYVENYDALVAVVALEAMLTSDHAAFADGRSDLIAAVVAGDFELGRHVGPLC